MTPNGPPMTKRGPKCPSKGPQMTTKGPPMTPKSYRAAPRTRISTGPQLLSSSIPSTSVKVTKSPLSKPCRASSRHVTSPGQPYKIQGGGVRPYKRGEGGKKNPIRGSAGSGCHPIRGHLGDHGDHGAQGLLPVGVRHHQVVPEVAEELPVGDMGEWGYGGAL